LVRLGSASNAGIEPPDEHLRLVASLPSDKSGASTRDPEPHMGPHISGASFVTGLSNLFG
jgi:hypothetical protein